MNIIIAHVHVKVIYPRRYLFVGVRSIVQMVGGELNPATLCDFN